MEKLVTLWLLSLLLLACQPTSGPEGPRRARGDKPETQRLPSSEILWLDGRWAGQLVLPDKPAALSLSLKIEGVAVVGQCRREGQPRAARLEGSLRGDSLMLVETDQGRMLGRWVARLGPDLRLAGRWLSPDSTLNFPLEASPVPDIPAWQLMLLRDTLDMRPMGREFHAKVELRLPMDHPAHPTAPALNQILADFYLGMTCVGDPDGCLGRFRDDFLQEAQEMVFRSDSVHPVLEKTISAEIIHAERVLSLLKKTSATNRESQGMSAVEVLNLRLDNLQPITLGQIVPASDSPIWLAILNRELANRQMPAVDRLPAKFLLAPRGLAFVLPDPRGQEQVIWLPASQIKIFSLPGSPAAALW